MSVCGECGAEPKNDMVVCVPCYLALSEQVMKALALARRWNEMSAAAGNVAASLYASQLFRALGKEPT